MENARRAKTLDDAQQILTDEYTVDPLGRGYAAMNDQEATDDINSVYRHTDALFVSGAALHDAVDQDEEKALVDLWDQEELHRIYAMGERVPVGPNTRVRRFLVQTFPNGTLTYDKLLEMFRDPISRAAELGLPEVKVAWTEQTKPQT